MCCQVFLTVNEPRLERQSNMGLEGQDMSLRRMKLSWSSSSIPQLMEKNKYGAEIVHVVFKVALNQEDGY